MVTAGIDSGDCSGAEGAGAVGQEPLGSEQAVDGLIWFYGGEETVGLLCRCVGHG